MTFTVALILLTIGIAIGYCLYEPVARLRALLRDRRYKPTVLHAYEPDADFPPKDS
jgi:hypothetical protein